MEQDKAARPVDISFFGADAVVQGSYCGANLIEQFGLIGVHDGILQPLGGFIFSLQRGRGLDLDQCRVRCRDKICENVNMTST